MGLSYQVKGFVILAQYWPRPTADTYKQAIKFAWFCTWPHKKDVKPKSSLAARMKNDEPSQKVAIVARDGTFISPGPIVTS